MNNSNEVSKRTFVPKTIGESLQKVNQKFSSKFGRIDYVIHVKWKQIVGPFFANHSQPMKISSVKDFIDDKNEYIFSNYLHVNVSPAAAVDFQHFKDKITEKINSYFGYKTIKGIKIHQNFIPKFDDDPTNKKKPKNTIKLNEEVKKHVQGIRNKDLEESVVKLGLSISTEDE